MTVTADSPHFSEHEGKSVYFCSSGCKAKFAAEPAKYAIPNAPDSSAQLKDPVCGMTVTAQSPHVHEYEGKPVYFCSAGCKAKFAADPAKYMRPPLAGEAASVEIPVVAGTIYTCPMHPEVRQDHPGACPKCGMAL